MIKYNIIKNIFTKHPAKWKIIDRIGIVLGFLGFIITIFQVLPTLYQTKSDVQIIQEKLNSNEAEGVLYSYFYNIEQRNFTDAFNLFTDKKKQNDSIEKFSSWLNDFVAFEGL